MPAKSPARSYTYDFTTGMLTGEDDPDGSKEFWTYQTDTLTIDSQSDTYVVPTATGEGIDSLSSDGILPVNLAISFSYGGDTYTYAPNMLTAADSVVYSAIGDYAGEYGNSSGDYLVANLTDGAITGWTYYDYSTSGASVADTGVGSLPADSSAWTQLTEVYSFGYYSGDGDDGNPGDLESVTHVGRRQHGQPGNAVHLHYVPATQSQRLAAGPGPDDDRSFGQRHDGPPTTAKDCLRRLTCLTTRRCPALRRSTCPPLRSIIPTTRPTT